jgi:hypothetical protein
MVAGVGSYQVNFGTKLITMRGKGDRLITKTINDEVRSILWPLDGHHPTRVFTSVAKVTRAPGHRRRKTASARRHRNPPHCLPILAGRSQEGLAAQRVNATCPLHWETRGRRFKSSRSDHLTD